MASSTSGWGNGLLGVIIFSGSLPATRVAVAEFSPLFLTSGRAVIAALIGLVLLIALKPVKPSKRDLVPLAIVAVGGVIGFPLLTGLALQHITAAHSIVFVGLLPLATAIFAVLRAGERPQRAFWIFSTIGGVVVAGFALYNSGGGAIVGDLLMIASILFCGLGYAEGAILSRRLGGWQVISWALLLSLPVMAVIALLTLPGDWRAIAWPSWAGFAYVAIFSQMLGFVFWYRGLALGGIATVAQIQLLQPFFGLLLAWALLGEPIAWTMITSTVIVILCVVGAKRQTQQPRR